MVTFETVWGAFFGLALGGAGLLVVVAGLRDARRLWRLVVADATDVGSFLGAEEGHVAKLTGSVRPTASTTETPLTRTDAVVHETTVKYYNRRKVPRWRTVTTDRAQPTFELTDETGSVTVDPEDAEFRLDPRSEYVPADPDRVSAPMERVLTRDDGTPYSTVRLSRHDLRVFERAIEPGETVSVVAVRGSRPGAADAEIVGGVGEKAGIAIAARAAFLVVFGLFLVSVLWFVSLPNFATLLG